MLALALGKHLHEIEDLPYEEFVRWMHFYSSEPFGLIREDMRSAIVAAASVQPHMRKGKTARVEDYMPKFRRAWQKQSKKSFDANVNVLVEMIKRARGSES